DRREDQHPDASPADSDTASHSAAVFDIRTLPLISPAHSRRPPVDLCSKRASILTLLVSADKELGPVPVCTIGLKLQGIGHFQDLEAPAETVGRCIKFHRAPGRKPKVSLNLDIRTLTGIR